VNEGQWLNPHTAGCLEALGTRSIAADSSDKIGVPRGSQVPKFSPVTRNAATSKFSDQFPRVVIDENDIGEVALCSNDVEHDFAMPTDTPDN
jgi:hypothetical protein